VTPVTAQQERGDNTSSDAKLRKRRSADYTVMVKWTSKLAVLAMAVSLWASPLMACMLPDADLTVEERECCKNMADDCGQMAMPASHSCCKIVTRQADSYVVNSRFPVVHSVSSVTGFVVPVQAPGPADLLHPNAVFEGHSPPTSPPTTISILRL